MRQRLRSHLTFANVVSVIALFVALGGTALASVIITSNSQVARDTISGHKPPSGKHSNLIAGSVNGKDIAKFSGVDACTPTLLAKFGRICAGSDGVARKWLDALSHCSSYGLRLPSVSEAITLAQNYAVPGVSTGQSFWTDDESDQVQAYADMVGKNGFLSADQESQTHQTVCVANPTN
jgi:hypothetical protein